jgi:hypothetical protein
MLIFRSEVHVDRWCRARDLPRGAILTPDQAWRLAYAWYKDKVKPEWRRYTPDEAEAILAGIGLTGPFWNLRGGP